VQGAVDEQVSVDVDVDVDVGVELGAGQVALRRAGGSPGERRRSQFSAGFGGAGVG
jgi:hypothetical protein